MINNNNYRPNVGIIICNINKKVLWARRYKQHSWQFPQGGINDGETAKQAMYRELFEEIGLRNNDVRILASTKKWLYYTIPNKLIRWDSNPIYIGQKQKWFLLQLICSENNINIKKEKIPEFDNWRWVNLWYPINQVITFKRNVYRQVIKEFSKLII